jgi:hypothetical protein
MIRKRTDLHLFHHGIPKVLVNPRSKGITSAWSTSTHHNVKERSFNMGDLVLRRIQNTYGLHKLNLPWDSPFSVSKVTGPGSYHLQTLKGEEIINSWNVDQLCHFYS